MSPTSTNRRVIPSSDALFQEIGGEAVILDLKSASYFGLNDVGARFWKVLLHDSSLSRAIDGLLVDFEVERAQLERDLDILVDQLLQAGLVQVE